MNSFVFNPRTKAFTLVELLVVIAIIGILAALLLPVLNGGQRRAQRIVCENNLREIGIAFHVFSNDHTGKFPAAVSTNDGGSMEFIESGFHAGENFYTAFHNFQVLSNELVRPQILICPSDMREVVSNFTALQNQNVSYFVGANGMFDKPTSILAGDRNLVTNSFETLTILQIGLGSRLSWTWEMHQFQGNILFADGHVEEWGQSGLKAGENQFSPDESLFLPSVVQVANSSPAGSGSTPDKPSAVMPMQPATPMSSASHKSRPQAISTASGSESSSETIKETVTAVTNATVAVAVPGDSPATMSSFDQHLTKTLQHTFEWLYLILLLLALLYLVYRLRKWMLEREAKLKARQLHQDPWED